MKKSLIALAVLAVAGAASAQSSVQLYGIADVWVGGIKATGTKAQTVVESGGVSGSRWGVKGSEDLGGGLKAIFTLEQGFAIDTGAAATGFNREASVGVAGNFGEVKLGKVWTAYDDVQAASNPVFDSALTPSAKAFASTGVVAENGDSSNIDTRHEFTTIGRGVQCWRLPSTTTIVSSLSGLKVNGIGPANRRASVQLRNGEPAGIGMAPGVVSGDTSSATSSDVAPVESLVVTCISDPRSCRRTCACV